jgi:hypothetical protein
MMKIKNKTTSLLRCCFVSAEGSNIISSMETHNKKAFNINEDFFVSAEGIEPSTNGLKGRCSTIELRAH